MVTQQDCRVFKAIADKELAVAVSLSPRLHSQGMPDDQVDLRREIAFNLSLIYQASGNVEMARQLICTHCVV